MEQDLAPAGWWLRAAATLLDAVFVVALALVSLVAGAVVGAATTDMAGIPFYVAALLVVLLYAALLMRREGERNGQTWGRQISGIRVVREDRRPMSLRCSFLRDFVVKGLLFAGIGGWFLVPWLLDVLWPLWDDRRRALHDMIVDTRVVKA